MTQNVTVPRPPVGANPHKATLFVTPAARTIVRAGQEWDSFFADDAPRVSDDFLPPRATP